MEVRKHCRSQASAKARGDAEQGRARAEQARGDTRGPGPVKTRGYTCCRPSAASASTARCAAGLAPAAAPAPLPLALALPPAAAPGSFAAAPAEGADADLGLAGGALLHMLLSALPPAAFLPGATLAGAPLPGAALAGAPFLGEPPAGPVPAPPLAAGAASAPGAPAALPGLPPPLGGAAGALWPALRPPAPPRDSLRLCVKAWASMSMAGTCALPASCTPALAIAQKERPSAAHCTGPLRLPSAGPSRVSAEPSVKSTCTIFLKPCADGARLPQCSVSFPRSCCRPAGAERRPRLRARPLRPPPPRPPCCALGRGLARPGTARATRLDRRFAVARDVPGGT